MEALKVPEAKHLYSLILSPARLLFYFCLRYFEARRVPLTHVNNKSCDAITKGLLHCLFGLLLVAVNKREKWNGRPDFYQFVVKHIDIYIGIFFSAYFPDCL